MGILLDLQGGEMKKVYLPWKLKRQIDLFLFIGVISGLIVWELFTINKLNNRMNKNTVVKQIEIVETEPIKYITNFELSQLYSLKEYPNNDTCLSLSVQDALLLMKIAKCEGGDDLKAQALIMRVLLNRLDSDLFPDTLTEILYQNKQFSAVSNGSYKKSVPNVNSHLALGMIESGWDESSGALYFEASWLKDSWQSKNLTFLFEYEGTRYYK